MVQSLQLGNVAQSSNQTGMKRLNRLPIAIVAGLTVLLLAIVVVGLSSRGLRFGQRTPSEAVSGETASSFAEQMKRGVQNGVIGDTGPQPSFQPAPTIPVTESGNRSAAPSPKGATEDRRRPVQPDEEWRVRLLREHEEQILRERQRQRMASLQARGAAYDSPLKIDISDLPGSVDAAASGSPSESGRATAHPDLYAALRAGIAGQNIDPNGQASKEEFFNTDLKELGYLPNRVVPQRSSYELKRGSVIPATMITGINSDLPGRITAQVSQNVYDSATGHHLLVPQGAKLFGRYDSKVSFGQRRVLVVWTDIIFANGSTLQIGGMAGTDPEGYGGFTDKVDRHYLRTFGSAALVAIIGTGIDVSAPEGSAFATRDTASDAVRRNFAETFGRVAEQTISKNLDVQPTIRVRPGYKFNILVDQDIVFPANSSL